MVGVFGGSLSLDLAPSLKRGSVVHYPCSVAQKKFLVCGRLNDQMMELLPEGQRLYSNLTKSGDSTHLPHDECYGDLATTNDIATEEPVGEAKSDHPVAIRAGVHVPRSVPKFPARVLRRVASAIAPAAPNQILRLGRWVLPICRR